jgi:hypothetical protein
VYVEGQPGVAETDADGRFTLTVPRGRQTINVSVIGYALLRTDVDVAGAPLDMTIRLSEGAGACTERVTVSGSLRGDSDSVPGSTSLHGRDLENLRGAVLDDPLRAIQALPSATATDDFYSEFAVRGTERALHVDAGVEHALPYQTRIMLNVYARQESDVLWRRDLEPRRTSTGAIQPGVINAPRANALSGDAHGVEVVVRREATSGFSGWAGYGFGQLKYRDTHTDERFWGDADQRHTWTLYGNYRLSSRASVSARYRYGSNYPILGYIGEPSPALGQRPIIDGRPLFYGLSTERNTVRLPPYSRLDVRADRAFNWSRRRLILFVDVSNIVNRINLRNSSYFVDRAGRVFEKTESLLPIVPSGGLVVEF